MRTIQKLIKWTAESKLPAVAILLFCSLAVTAGFDKNSTFLLLFITITAGWMYHWSFKQQWTPRTKICCGIYSFFLSQAIVSGNLVHYVEMRSSISENYIRLNTTSVLTGLSLAVLIYPTTLLLYHMIQCIKMPETPPNNSPQKTSMIFIVCWMFIFIAWLPYLSSYYPGGIVGDGACALEEALKSGVPSHSHWGILHILSLRFFLHLSIRLGSDLNFGVFLYVIAQSLLYSAVCAAVVNKLRSVGVPAILVCGTELMYAASGFFASFSISLWKDGLFSSAVLLLALLLWNLPEKSPYTARHIVPFTFISLFLCFWRSNGLYVLLLCLVGIALLLKKCGKQLIICGLTVAVFTMVVQGPVYEALHIGKDTLVQSFSVPIQQVAAAINEGAELTEYQKEILFQIIPEDIWSERYCPTLSDDLKNAADIIYLQDHAVDFIKIWFQLLLSNSGTYIRAYLMQMLGYWQPGVYQGNYYDYWLGIQDPFGRGWAQKDWIETLTGRSIRPVLEKRMEFIPSGTMVWGMLLALSLIIAQNSNSKKRLLVLLPLLASWCITLIAAPIAYAYRYIVMIPMALPILCTLLFQHQLEKKDREDYRQHIATAGKKCFPAIMAVFLFLSAFTAYRNLSHPITPEAFSGKEIKIFFSGNKYNATQYVLSGISEKESQFSWTDGEKMRVEIPVKGKYEQLQVDILIKGTFNGNKSYQILQNDTDITAGIINGEDRISFLADVIKNKLVFEMEFPDAQIIREVIEGSADNRKIAFQLQEISISIP